MGLVQRGDLVEVKVVFVVLFSIVVLTLDLKLCLQVFRTEVHSKYLVASVKELKVIKSIKSF